jgi:Gpi18-like mannosyltransferase
VKIFKKIDKIFYLLFIGFLIRILFSPCSGYKWDINTFKSWSLHISEVGLGKFYNSTWCDYSPFYLYILWGIGKLHKLLSLIFQINIFTFLIKFPSIIADLLIGYFIYIAARNLFNSRKAGYLSSFFYLFNPAIIYNSTIWGQIDAFLTLFIFLAIYFLNQKKIFLASLFSAIAVLIKPQGAIILPLFFFILYKKYRFKKTIQCLVLFMVAIYVFLEPFLINYPITKLASIYKAQAGEYPYTSVNAFNLWLLFSREFFKSDRIISFLFPNKIWGFIFFIIFCIYLLYRLNRNFSLKNIYLASFLIYLGFFLFPTRIHERYLFSVFPFLSIIIPINFKIKTSYILLSLSYFANMYYAMYAFTASHLFKEIFLILGYGFSVINLAVLFYILSIIRENKLQLRNSL